MRTRNSVAHNLIFKRQCEKPQLNEVAAKALCSQGKLANQE